MSTKYQSWYDHLVDRAQCREIPPEYTEMHHIIPRSFGGSDAPANLVRLTYREHFIAHWLLTKFTVGANLRKMRKALFAMTMQANGERIVAGWQFEVAKRAVAGLRLTPELIRLRELAEKARRDAGDDYLSTLSYRRREAFRLSEDLLKSSPPSAPSNRRKSRRPPGPSQRKRLAMRAAREASAIS